MSTYIIRVNEVPPNTKKAIVTVSPELLANIRNSWMNYLPCVDWRVGREVAYPLQHALLANANIISKFPPYLPPEGTTDIVVHDPEDMHYWQAERLIKVVEQTPTVNGVAFVGLFKAETNTIPHPPFVGDMIEQVGKILNARTGAVPVRIIPYGYKRTVGSFEISSASPEELSQAKVISFFNLKERAKVGGEFKYGILIDNPVVQVPKSFHFLAECIPTTALFIQYG